MADRTTARPHTERQHFACLYAPGARVFVDKGVRGDKANAHYHVPGGNANACYGSLRRI